MHGSFPNKATYSSWVSALWATAHNLGMSEDAVRDVVEQVSNQRSVRALSMEQMKAWFTRVEEMYGRRGDSPESTRRKNRRRNSGTVPSGNIIYLATPEQRDKIRTFARNDLGWRKYWNPAGTECESICRVIEKHTKGKKRYISQLDLYEARAVIETLKFIKDRKKKKGTADERG